MTWMSLHDALDAYVRLVKQEQRKRAMARSPLPDTSVWYAAEGRALVEEAHWVLEGRHKEQAKWVVQRMMKHGLKSLLELGCGTGIFAGWVRRHFAAVQYLGVDACPAFVEMAKRRCPELAFVCEDLRTRPADRPDDLVCCWNVLKNIGLHEWDDVLRHVLSLGRHAAFNVQVLGEDLDNGTEYHHVYVNRQHLLWAVSAAGHEVVEEEQTGESPVEGHGLMKEITVWSKKV